MLATVALLGASLLPSVAFAQSAEPYPYRSLPVQCAVGYTAGPERVAMTLESLPDQNLVDVAATICSNMIADGAWSGIDSQGSWRPGMRLVAILQPIDSPDMGFNIWATPDTQSIQMAATMAYQLNETGNYRVAYPNS